MGKRRLALEKGSRSGGFGLGTSRFIGKLVWLAELRRPEWKKKPHFSGGMVRQTRFPVSSGGSPDDTSQWPVPPSYGLLVLIRVR